MKLPDLRLSSIERKTPVTVWVNDRRVTAYEGEPLHAVLLAAGYRELRTSVSETEHRGFFCGMGVCYDCLVTINDVPNQRACMTPVEDCMEIQVDE